jgi:hypothetical protein
MNSSSVGHNFKLKFEFITKLWIVEFWIKQVLLCSVISNTEYIPGSAESLHLVWLSVVLSGYLHPAAAAAAVVELLPLPPQLPDLSAAVVLLVPCVAAV